MNPEHARFAEWDAAYVLGALAPDDRRLFEEHLETCDLCRRAVAEVGPTAALLSRVPAERARAVGDEASEPAAKLRDGVLSAARRRRSRRRMAWAGALAAAAVVVAAVAIPATMALTAPSGTEHVLAGVEEVPLEASVRLTDVPWGTRIDLVCRYSGDVLDAPEDGWPYALAVVDADGAETTLSTWRAAPGSTTQLSAGTDLALSDIGAVEIRTLSGDRVLMRYDTDAASAPAPAPTSAPTD